MENPILVKTYEAGAAINPFRIVTFGASDRKVIQGAGITTQFVGVTRAQEAAASGDRVEACHFGIGQVQYGGTVTRGQPLTSDSVGRAIAATLDPNNQPNLVGFAIESGVVGDIRPIVVNPTPALLAASASVLSAQVTIATAAVLALNATPGQVVAAPGAGKALIPVMIQVYKPAGTAYAGIAAGEDLAIRYENGSGDILATLETTGFLDQASAQTRVILPVTTTLTPAANKALVAHLLTGEIITGTSDLLILVHYKVIDTVLA